MSTPRRYVIAAFRRDGSRILGNLDGQAVLECSQYRRTKHYKALRSGSIQCSQDVHKWQVESHDGTCCHEVIVRQ